MKTPLYDSLNNVIKQNTLRLHMPGHKGKSFFKPFDKIFEYDFTETKRTGNLYEEDGAIRKAELLAAKYYGAQDCHFLTGGSTQGIHAALGYACGIGGSVLIDRCCHKSVVCACAIFDLKTYFIYPKINEKYGFSGNISIKEQEQILKENKDIRAMIIVSPNYYGVVQDIKEISRVCRKYNVKLIVDSAHGAHFKAIGFKSPIELGADIAILSGHKTLPVMGQGAYILTACKDNKLREFESMLGTSSPSYPIMLSLDLARNFIETTDFYYKCVIDIQKIKDFINNDTAFFALDEKDGFVLDKCRLVINTKCANICAQEIYDKLENDFNIVCEMADNNNIVCIMTPYDTKKDLLRLKNALAECSRGLKKRDLICEKIVVPKSKQILTVRKAWFSDCEQIDIKYAVGRICSKPLTPYPPGVPILFSGEQINLQHIEFLKQQCYNSKSKVFVCNES